MIALNTGETELDMHALLSYVSRSEQTTTETVKRLYYKRGDQKEHGYVSQAIIPKRCGDSHSVLHLCYMSARFE